MSLLGVESIRKIKEKGLSVQSGDFAENIITRGICLWELPVGKRLGIGESAILEVTQIGKTCHHRREIFHPVGNCVMPREGIFARVLRASTVRPGDSIQRV